MFWAIWEYDQYVSGNYSGLENRVKKDAGLRKWLLSSLKLPDADAFLKNGEIITNVVGMSHIPWHAYLDLDCYIGKGGFYLLREPNNQSDAKAIMVYLEGFGKAGYIKRPLAAMLAPLMDQGVEIGAELFARHYPYYDLDMTLHLRLKQSTEPLKPPI
ncbi:MAG: HIRAN domain-containing protein [Syntrophales bacterium]|nr:HIRAN domain-containing protein [Syntrophales bacterium]